MLLWRGEGAEIPFAPLSDRGNIPERGYGAPEENPQMHRASEQRGEYNVSAGKTGQAASWDALTGAQQAAFIAKIRPQFEGVLDRGNRFSTALAPGHRVVAGAPHVSQESRITAKLLASSAPSRTQFAAN